MIDAPLALAFSAGLVATVNPCGFAMLPAYLGYFLGSHEAGPATNRGAAPGRALGVGAAVSAGFLTVFALAGTLFSAGFRAFVDYVPWISLVLGVGLVGLGVSMLFGFRLSVTLPRLERGGRRRGLASMFVFGVSYAVASLGCTLPVFLTVVSGTVTRANFVSGLVSFVAYGLGMSVVLVALTLALALAKGSVVRTLERAVRYVDRISALLLIIAGVYLTYYWVANLASEPGKRPGAAGWTEQLSAGLTTWLDTNSARVGIVLAGIVLATLAYLLTDKLLGPAGTDDAPRGGGPHPARPSPDLPSAVESEPDVLEVTRGP